MDIQVTDIGAGKRIPEKYAYCAPDGKGTTRDGGNNSPAISWSHVPAGTKSFTLIVVDKDVPASFELANKAGETIPASAPRRNFYHWIMSDIPASTAHLPENTARLGKIGRNDFAARSKGKAGYDGPCPPWNDERLHHYHFIIYALDVPSLGLEDGFSGPEAEEAMKGHILAAGEAVGTYTNNPKVR